MDVQVENFALNTSNDQTSGIWKLTRAMKTAGWRYKASADGTTKDSTGNPNNDLWGPGVQVVGQTGGGGFTIGAPTTTAYGGRSVVTGIPGATFTTASVGHFLKIVGATNAGNNGTFLITNFNSATSVTIENPAAVPETLGVGGGQSWTELSAMLDVYPTLTTGAWWCAQGPSVMKIPIDGNVPTGTFIRGENVTQTTSGATGEFMGIVTDTLTNQGYMVIAPRLSGTGSGPRGWSNNTITGSRSGATISPGAASTPIEFVREIVFWRDSLTAGHIYFQVIDQASEATPSATGTGRFSTMATAASVTATLCPGGAAANSPTNNGFPLIGSYVPSGQGGPGVATTGSRGWFNGGTINAGKCQLIATNCIEDANVSADGTLIFAGGCPPSTVNYAGWGFFRLDDQEDGDVDPYAWWIYDTRISNSRTRTLGNNTQPGADVWQIAQIYNGTPFLGWRRRGWQSPGNVNGDSWLEMQGYLVGNAGGPFANSNTATPERLACTVVTTTPREPIWVVGNSVLNSVPFKIRKGTLRWMFLVQGNASNDTYDTKRWIQLSSTNFPLVVGPGDGTTTPVNQ